MRFPNESAEYSRAREALLVEEIELRRQIERVVYSFMFGQRVHAARVAQSGIFGAEKSSAPPPISDRICAACRI
jgi:predicted dithiol-disulfide oxidoreductase (DUF899 family)